MTLTSVVQPSEGLKASSITQKSYGALGSKISFGKTYRQLSNAKKTSDGLVKLLKKKDKKRKEIYKRIKQREKNYESLERDDRRESSLELRKIGKSAEGNIMSVIKKTGGGLLGKLLMGAGLLVATSLLKYIAPIVGYAKEFGARVTKFIEIGKDYFNGLNNLISSTGRALSILGQNILSFDFSDSTSKLRDSLGEIEKTFNDLGNTNQELIDVFTKDLVKEIDGVDYGTYSGEEIPPVGGYPDSGDGTASGSGKGYSSSQTTPTGYSNVFELIASGEGGYESINRGNAGDSPGGAKRYLGKNLRDMTLTEIMGLQRKGEVFAVGKYQLIDKTMPGFVRYLEEKGYDPNTTKYSESIQEIFPEYVVNRKRPTVGKYLRGESGVTEEDAAQSLAREFASVGLSRPEAGRGVGQSRYAGVGDNRASISPQEVQQALRESREGMKKGSISSESSTKLSVPTGSSNATFGETGNVSNQANWVHGHFQTNTGNKTDLINDVTPIVKGLLASGVPTELSKGQKFHPEMTDSEIRGLISLGISQHTHSGDGRSIDIFVPKGTKVPFPLTDVYTRRGGREGRSGILPGSGKVWVGHLTPDSKSGGIAGAPTTPTISPATGAPAISSAKDMQKSYENMILQKKSKDVIVNVPGRGPQYSPVSVSGSKYEMRYREPSIGEALNKFMRQKLLLDLSYT